jgi:hypothetical protein
MRGIDLWPNSERDSDDLNALLHPAQAFDHPRDVARDPDLTLNEKRAILASWASDACAVEAAPGLRCAPGGRRAVKFDEVMDALRALDRELHEAPTPRPGRRLPRSSRRRGSPDGSSHGSVSG